MRVGDVLNSEPGLVLLVGTFLVVAFDWGGNIIAACSSICVEPLCDGEEVEWDGVTGAWGRSGGGRCRISFLLLNLATQPEENFGIGKPWDSSESFHICLALRMMASFDTLPDRPSTP